jgi:hypothetical protein
MWQRHLDEYLAAKRERDEATRLFWRALRAMERLAPRIGDDHAMMISGVDLADERGVRAAGKERRAYDKLKKSLPQNNTAARLAIMGRVLCADLPKAANR